MENDFLFNYSKSKPKFLSLGDGEEVKVQFLEAKVTISEFSNEECIKYRLKHGKVNKFLISGSGDLAREMSAIPKGSIISIKRVGLGYSTRYLVAMVSEKEKQEYLATNVNNKEIPN